MEIIPVCVGAGGGGSPDECGMETILACERVNGLAIKDARVDAERTERDHHESDKGGQTAAELLE